MVFLAVARDSSFARAAEKFGISGPAVSQTISKLECRLGVPLLKRTSRSVSTTEAGQALLEKVGPLMDQVDAALDALGSPTAEEKPPSRQPPLSYLNRNSPGGWFFLAEQSASVTLISVSQFPTNSSNPL